MKVKSILTILAILYFVPINAVIADDDLWGKSNVENLKTELVMELNVRIDKAVIIGDSDKGLRQYIPITGGEFYGESIKGNVLPGGADWQLIRKDGVIEIVAIYAIQTDDGQVISVDNRGFIDTNSTPPYVRTSPTFKTAIGKYDWLNRRVFTGTISPSKDGSAVTIRVFKVL